VVGDTSTASSKAIIVTLEKDFNISSRLLIKSIELTVYITIIIIYSRLIANS
jgi:hypothetical protein